MKTRFKIGEVARIKNIDAQTLRYYEKLGLIMPDDVDPITSYRYYSLGQFIEVDHIKFLKLLGLTLKEIQDFNSINEIDQALAILNAKQVEIDLKISRLTQISEIVSSINNVITNSAKVNRTNPNLIIIQERDPILGIIGDYRAHDELYHFETVLKDMTDRYPNYSEIGHNHDLCMIHSKAIFKEYSFQSLEKVLLPYKGSAKNTGTVEQYPLGRCIIAYHKGSTQEIMQTMSRLSQYIKENSLKIRGDVLLKPIITGFIIKNKSEHLREVIIPLAAH